MFPDVCLRGFELRCEALATPRTSLLARSAAGCSNRGSINTHQYTEMVVLGRSEVAGGVKIR